MYSTGEEKDLVESIYIIYFIIKTVMSVMLVKII